jgi:hypothetical protein
MCRVHIILQIILLISGKNAINHFSLWTDWVQLKFMWWHYGSDDHIWCIKKYNNTWFNLDSLSHEPKPIQFRSIFNRQGFGWIIVWNNIKSISNEQSFESHSEIVQHFNMDSTNKNSDNVIMNQSSKLPSKRSSKRNRMEENDIFDESFSVLERNELSQSNRFQILSFIEQ